MKHVIGFALLVAALVVAAGQSGAGQPRQLGAAEEEVRKLERAWLDAYEQHDTKAMAAIVSDDFLITFADGSMQTKPQILASIRAPRNPAGPSFKFHTEDVRARVYGDAVVVLTGRVVTEFTRDGKAVREQNRYTDTYVRRQGRWQVVASHLSNVAPPRPQKPSAPQGTGNQ